MSRRTPVAHDADRRVTDYLSRLQAHEPPGQLADNAVHRALSRTRRFGRGLILSGVVAVAAAGATAGLVLAFHQARTNVPTNAYAGWQTYDNAALKMSLRHPPGWTVTIASAALRGGGTDESLQVWDGTADPIRFIWRRGDDAYSHFPCDYPMEREALASQTINMCHTLPDSQVAESYLWTFLSNHIYGELIVDPSQIDRALIFKVVHTITFRPPAQATPFLPPAQAT
jgi:hypothetical protein